MKDEDRLPWFPCEPLKLLEALTAMKPHVGYTYWIVCLRCYDVGGPCPDSLDTLARRTGYSKRIVSDAIDVLLAGGKLVRETGGIVNPYAIHVLDEMRARRGRRSAAGKEGANRKWEKSDKNQTHGDGIATQSPSNCHPHLQLQLQVKGKKKDSSAVGKPTRRDEEFEKFWNAYPRRDGANPKAPAAKVFHAAIKSGTPAGEIVAGAARCAVRDSSKIGTPYIPQAVKWLRDRRWQDYPSTEAEDRAVAGFHADAESAQYAAWQIFKRKTRPGWSGRDNRGGWWFPTEWPPGFVPVAGPNVTRVEEVL